MVLLAVMSEILLGWWVSCVDHWRPRSTVLITILLFLRLVFLLWLVRMMTVGSWMSRIFRSGCPGRRRLFLLHLMRLVYFGELLLHVVVQTLVPRFVLLLVNFDTDDPFAVAARVVLSIFGYGSGNWR